MTSLVGCIGFGFTILVAMLADDHMETSYGHPNSLQNLLIHGLVDELGIKLKQKAASLDFDGSEDNLNLLLSEEKNKNFRLGADGELHTP